MKFHRNGEMYRYHMGGPHKCTRHFRPWIPTNSDRFRPFPTYPTGRGRVENKRKFIFYDFQNSDQIPTIFRPFPTIFRHIRPGGIGRKRSGALMGGPPGHVGLSQGLGGGPPFENQHLISSKN